MNIRSAQSGDAHVVERRQPEEVLTVAAARNAAETVLEVRLLQRVHREDQQAHPGLLEREWLGTPVLVADDEAELRTTPNPKAKALASVAPGTVLRQVATDAGWSRVVLPDHSGLAWVATSAVQLPGAALP